MTQVATTPSQVASSSFLWRRLHSLSGILPVGLFLLYHIYENMSAPRIPEPYNVMVNDVNPLLPRPYFYVLEVTAILGPLLFHAHTAFTSRRPAGRTLGRTFTVQTGRIGSSAPAGMLPSSLLLFTFPRFDFVMRFGGVGR